MGVLKLRDLPAYTSQVLGLKAYITTPGLDVLLFFFFFLNLFANNKILGLERQLSGQEHLLLLKRIWVQFTALT